MKSSLTSYRYERKFYAQNLTEQELITQIKLHPACFRQIFYPRFINNVYFDTHNYEFLQQSINGDSQRKKIRLRWYGDVKQHPISPNCEIKIKRGLLGTKHIFSIKQATLSQILNSYQNLSTVIQKNQASFHHLTRKIQPVLFNRYKRSYYLSNDQKYRLTIDTQLSFKKIVQSQIDHKSMKLRGVILEIKYANSNDDQVDKISNYFAINLSKFSKYVWGMHLLF